MDELGLQLNEKFKDTQYKADAYIDNVAKRNITIKYILGEEIEYVVVDRATFIDRRSKGRYHSFNLN